MTERVLYLFPDTNLFEQCRALNELDWKVLGDFDEIRLIVCRVVQQQIDGHKNQGGARISDRARKTSSLFREIVTGTSDHVVIRDAGPRVSITLALSHEPSKTLARQLNYDHSDDRLVGTVQAFIELNPGSVVRLLTDDTGPMASAKMAGVPFVATPEDWRLPPEAAASEKELNRLKSEISALKKAEPEFTVTCVNADGQPIEKLEAAQLFYKPLSDDEVSELMGRIRERFPVETDFGSTEPTERASPLFSSALLGGRETFTPATQEEIAEYLEETFPQWLEACETFLRRYHHVAQQQTPVPSFRFVAGNVGTRPAKDALVIIEARGDFKIEPFPWREENDDGEKVQARKRAQELPEPPSPPRGTWKVRPNLYDTMSTYDRMFGRPMLDTIPIMPRMPTLAEQMKKRDPNGFFWKPDRPDYPVSQFTFECEQWRHLIAAEEFGGQLDCPPEAGSISGALECQIHADNLSTITGLVVPVRVAIRHLSAHAKAKELVDRFTRDPFAGLSLRLRKAP